MVDVFGILRGACRGGHTEIVKYMIMKGANDFRSAINAVCDG